ncbi:MAG: pentapeptide repeat-containing protein [Myxococcota bacterium]
MSDNILRTPHEVAELTASGTLDGVLVEAVDLSKQGLKAVHASDVTFKRVGLHQAPAVGSEFSRCKFTESSLRGGDFSGSLFRASSYFASELIEAKFGGCTLSNTSFYNCRMGNSNFAGARITSGNFNGCELFGANFARSLLVNTRFDAPERGNIPLDRADFSNAILVDCDLMGANFYGASFKDALLIKVDLRHANLSEADFTGAHLIDVHIDSTLLEPGVARAVEAARVDDPWRRHGFMKEVLEVHSNAEMQLLLEYVLRTYVIEGAQPAQPADSFANLLSQLRGQYDFPELDRLRLRGVAVQVQVNGTWQDLMGGSAPTAEPTGPAPEARPAPAGPPLADASPSPAPPAEPPSAPPEPARPPKGVGRSKRFRSLEID